MAFFAFHGVRREDIRLAVLEWVAREGRETLLCCFDSIKFPLLNQMKPQTGNVAP